jgi:hypothetical protein
MWDTRVPSLLLLDQGLGETLAGHRPKGLVLIGQVREPVKPDIIDSAGTALILEHSNDAIDMIDVDMRDNGQFEAALAFWQVLDSLLEE